MEARKEGKLESLLKLSKPMSWNFFEEIRCKNQLILRNAELVLHKRVVKFPRNWIADFVLPFTMFL